MEILLSHVLALVAGAVVGFLFGRNNPKGTI